MLQITPTITPIAFGCATESAVMNWRRFISPSSGAPGPFVRPLLRRAAFV
jgi:hypothetical protein